MPKQLMLSNMLEVAMRAHAGQFDKGGVPYILHPLEVMRILNSNDEELNCIAIGHDVLEDSDLQPADLLMAGMSHRVVQGIIAMTKKNGDNYDEYVESLMGNIDAVKVKIADLTHNSDIRRLKGVTDKDIARMAKYHRTYMILKEVAARSPI